MGQREVCIFRYSGSTARHFPCSTVRGCPSLLSHLLIAAIEPRAAVMNAGDAEMVGLGSPAGSRRGCISGEIPVFRLGREEIGISVGKGTGRRVRSEERRGGTEC